VHQDSVVEHEFQNSAYSSVSAECLDQDTVGSAVNVEFDYRGYSAGAMLVESECLEFVGSTELAESKNEGFCEGTVSAECQCQVSVEIQSEDLESVKLKISSENERLGHQSVEQSQSVGSDTQVKSVENDLEGSVAGVTAHFTRILAKMKSEMELNDAKHEIELSSVKHELELSYAQHQIELAAAKHEVALSVAKHEMEIAALRREMEIAAAKRKMELAIAKHDMLQFSSSAVDEGLITPSGVSSDFHHFGCVTPPKSFKVAGCREYESISPSSVVSYVVMPMNTATEEKCAELN